MDPLTSKLAAAFEHLQRTQETFRGTVEFLIEAEYELRVSLSMLDRS
jgi:hypothetical protein